MHIVIVTLHVRRSSQAIPLAAGCLKASLPEPLRQSTELLDFYPDQDNTIIISDILKRKADLIAFPLYVWNRRQVLRISSQLRRMKPDLILLAGGPEASADCEKVVVEGDLNGVICGEGEKVFAEYVTRISNDQSVSDIAGLFEKDNHSPLKTAVCPELSELTSPWLNADIPLKAGCGVLWESARGCYFNCAFCYDAKGHQGVRPLPRQRLKQELELFVKKQVSQAWILDSTFNAPPGRGKKLLELLLDTAPQIHYHIEAKADLLDDDTIELLSRLSCSVQIGLQSANPDILKPLQRALDLQNMQSQLRKLSRAGVTFGLDLIYGLPGDNYSGFINSLNFALRQQPNQVDMFPLAVLPGTELFHRRDAFNVRGQQSPPYLIEHNATYSSSDMEKSRLIAALTDIFYNRGRAVGFFLQVCQALKLTPADFLQNFGLWLERRKSFTRKQIIAVENWQPDRILPLQVEFVKKMLREKNLDKLISISEDLIHYHYACAEILLAEKTQPFDYEFNLEDALNRRWKLHPAVIIQSFHYTPYDLEYWGGEALGKISHQLKIDPSKVIFLHQDGEIIIESLEEDFAKLLKRAENPTLGKNLLKNLKGHSGNEQLRFAISQGILLPVT